MKINWDVRRKNIVYIAQIILAIATPVFAYAGITAKDITTWAALADLIKMAINNPYVLLLIVLSVWNATTDPTTPGVSDSQRVLEGNNQPIIIYNHDDEEEGGGEDESIEGVEEEELS